MGLRIFPGNFLVRVWSLVGIRAEISKQHNQTCPNLSTIQRPCTLFAHSNFALSNVLVLQSYILSCWICIFNLPNRELSNGVRVMELYWSRNVDPSRGASWSSVERNFSKFSGKNLKELWFSYLLTNPAETAYLSFRDQELSNDARLVQLRRGKIAVHTFWGWSQAGLIRQRSCRNYRKPKLFLSYVVSWWNCTFELS